MDRRDHRHRRRRLSLWLLALALALAGGLLAAGCANKVILRGRLDRAAVHKVAERISSSRALPFLKPVRLRLSGSADLARAAGREARAMRSDGRATARSQALAMLGVLNDAGALADGTEAMLASQPGGVYVPQAARLDVFDRPHVKSEIIEVLALILGRDLTFGEIVAHELAHALQDQHFGLDPPPAARENDDAVLAHAALVEGDAFLAGFDLGIGGLLTGAAEFVTFAERHAPDMGAAVPDYLEQRFAFPYLAGTRFVLALKKATPAGDPPWSRVDAAHRAPPRSSEEILHPEKYLAGDDPPRLPDLAHLALALPGREQLYQDSLGEFGIRQLVGRGQKPARAAELAAGWGGDRLALFAGHPGEAPLLIWIADWDTAADAAAFFEGFEAQLIRRFGSPGEAALGESRWSSPERQRLLALDQRRVIYLDAAAADDLYRLGLAAARVGSEAPPGPTPRAPATGSALTLDEALVLDPHRPRYREQGPGIRLGTDSLGLTVGALLEVQGVRGAGERPGGLGLWGARVRADGRLAQGLDLGLRLELALEDPADPDSLLRDAFISFAPVSPHLAYVGHFRVGRMKAPASRSRLRERWQLPLAERLLTAALWAPDRRVGIAYDLDLARHGVPLALWAGAYDGFPQASNHGPLLCARMQFTPSHWFADLMSLELGAAWLWDRSYSTDDEAPGRDRRGGIVDGRLAAWGMFVEGELFWLDQDPGAAFERFAWALTAGVDLLPDFLRLSARYEELNRVDLEPEPGRVIQVTGGLTLFYLGDRFWMMFNSIWRRADGRADEVQHLLRFSARI